VRLRIVKQPTNPYQYYIKLGRLIKYKYTEIVNCGLMPSQVHILRRVDLQLLEYDHTRDSLVSS
jgi:hypothetical protein